MPRRVLVLGASGFVGTSFCRALLDSEAKAGNDPVEIIALSRRGGPGGDGSKEDAPGGGTVRWVGCDATRDDDLKEALARNGPYVAIVHCLGVLLDGKSGLGRFNWIVSAAGSLPDPESSYEEITVRTSLTCLEFLEQQKPQEQKPVFVFISAAEAGWADLASGRLVERYVAPKWLKRYLAAKRTVERRCAELTAGEKLRAVVMRPSFVWNWKKLDILIPTCIFTVLNKLRLPCIDRPVHENTISRAMVSSLRMGKVAGPQRYFQMEALADSCTHDKRTS